MASLLDGLNDPLLNLGLQLWGAGSTNRNFGAGALQALQGTQGFMQQQAALKRQAEKDALNSRLVEAQIGETQAQAKEREAMVQKAQQLAVRNALFQQQLQGGTVTPQQALTAGGGPTVANAAQIGTSTGPDYASIARQFPEQADVLKKLAEAKDWGRNEVARTIEGMDAQGRPSTMQYDKFGGQVGVPTQQWKAPVFQDLGGNVAGIDPVSRAQLVSFAKTQDPNSIASTGLGYARLNFDKAKDARDTAAADQAVEYKPDANGNLIALPKKVAPGATSVTPLSVQGQGNKVVQGANDVLALTKEARQLIPDATGSWLGNKTDQAFALYGGAPSGAQSIAKLKVLQAGIMLKQPRMEGPQSDKDVMLYREAAGQLGDPTVPSEIKIAALDTIETLQRRYANGQAGQPPGARATPAARVSSDADYNALPSGTTFVGPDGVTRRKP